MINEKKYILLFLGILFFGGLLILSYVDFINIFNFEEFILLNPDFCRFAVGLSMVLSSIMTFIRFIKTKGNMY